MAATPQVASPIAFHALTTSQITPHTLTTTQSTPHILTTTQSTPHTPTTLPSSPSSMATTFHLTSVLKSTGLMIGKEKAKTVSKQTTTPFEQNLNAVAMVVKEKKDLFSCRKDPTSVFSRNYQPQGRGRGGERRRRRRRGGGGERRRRRSRRKRISRCTHCC